jgi:rhodanese-related sulfurtransferase
VFTTLVGEAALDLGGGAWQGEAMTRRLALAAALVLLAAADFAGAQSIMKVPRIEVAELHDLVVAKKAVVLDVRSRDRWRMQHIPGALNVPFGSESEAAAKLAKETRPIVTYCTCNGDTSAARAAVALDEAGVRGVKVLRGGLAAWEKAGHPMEK